MIKTFKYSIDKFSVISEACFIGFDGVKYSINDKECNYEYLQENHKYLIEDKIFIAVMGGEDFKIIYNPKYLGYFDYFSFCVVGMTNQIIKRKELDKIIEKYLYNTKDFEKYYDKMER